MITIEKLRPELTEAFDRYLLKRPDSLFYYCSKYKNFLRDLLDCDEHYLVAVEGAEIRGILPLMFMEREGRHVYNSLPFYGSNGGVIADDHEISHKLVEAYNRIARDEATLSSTVVSNPLGSSESNGIEHNLTDYRIGQFTDISFQSEHRDEILKRIDASARRNFNKAIREGVTVEVDPNAMDRLRQMHQANIEAIGGIPKVDKFFQLIPRHFTAGQDFDLYVAKKDGVVISGLLLFYFNQTVEYITPAIDAEFRGLQPLAPILIEALTNASRRGFKWWNWGGTWATQSGVYRFKKKWGAAERNYRYYTQLNDLTILEWPQEKFLRSFPNFYVAPFAALKPEGVTK
ncbi:MAG TPA: peptidoglycan bridge formation glycyltransferase FemA/FemB family protein [Pyrinomonadaceae bacterium]|nr:peptidoglycan bridge formation glycyltransferase FemA/FemB family protein [Pyrinomonadaceae bacterium]